MDKINLNKAADQFEMINAETHMFYNIKTGEFDWYSDFSDYEDDTERFEDDDWITAPNQRDINEYDMMVCFTKTVTDPHKNELLRVALEGRGAFRWFKDTLHRSGLRDDWFKYKREAYIEIARKWCVKNNLEYENDEKPNEPQQTSVKNISFDRITYCPLSIADSKKAAEVLRKVFPCCYDGNDAEDEIKNMLKKERIAFTAIAGNRIVGIIGAIPQYGVTGWEMHPLAVLEDYRGKGIGKALVEILEKEVAKCGGIMIYLGSDDEFGTTSLFGEDLYEDTFEKITNIENIGNHPFTFYEKLGYKIVGVIPDANGIGKPDIWMAKKIK